MLNNDDCKYKMFDEALICILNILKINLKNIKKIKNIKFQLKI